MDDDCHAVPGELDIQLPGIRAGGMADFGRLERVFGCVAGIASMGDDHRAVARGPQEGKEPIFGLSAHRDGRLRVDRVTVSPSGARRLTVCGRLMKGVVLDDPGPCGRALSPNVMAGPLPRPKGEYTGP